MIAPKKTKQIEANKIKKVCRVYKSTQWPTIVAGIGMKAIIAEVNYYESNYIAEVNYYKLTF